MNSRKSQLFSLPLSGFKNVLNKIHIVFAHHNGMMAKQATKFPPAIFIMNPISIPPMVLSSTTKITVSRRVPAR